MLTMPSIRKCVITLLGLFLLLGVSFTWPARIGSAMSTCATPYTTSTSAGPCNNCQGNSTGIASGDLNGDTLPDLVIAWQGATVGPTGFQDGNISVHLDNGPATYNNVATFLPPNSINPMDLELADFNNDGKLDLAVVYLRGGGVTVQFGDGAGNFGAATHYNAGSFPFSIATGDLNNDGRPDIVVANLSSSNISVLINNGTGSFGSPTNITVGASPRHVQIGDLNNDGNKDVVVTSDNKISVLLGNGTGGFGPVNFYTVGVGPLRLLIYDLNNDGNADVVTSNVNANTISVLLGNGTGAFGAATNYATGTAPRGITQGDFNGDGLIDIAVGVNNAINVFLATAPGVFAAPTSHGPTGAGDILAADVNQDGGLDLVIPGPWVLLNSCIAPDLMLMKSHSGTFHTGTNASYTLTVKNSGGAAIGGTTTVSDVLPTGLSYVSASGTNWSCSAVGQTVTCTTNDIIPSGSSTTITLTVLPSCLATPGVTNTASVSNPNDPQPGNNSASDPTVVVGIVPANFDGDLMTDIGVWQPDTGNWVIRQSADRQFRIQFDWGRGSLGDKPVPGDYDGDGKTDIAIFRPSEGNWYIILSSTNAIRLNNWGGAGDIPVPRDYDGDSKTDIAVFRPSEGNWYIIRSSNNTVLFRGWGLSGDKPVPADYDGDCLDDIAVFRPSEGNWYIIQSATNTARLQNWGGPGDQPVQGDYDGDHKTDIAIYRFSEGNWYIIQSGTNTVRRQNWGANADLPVPGDYDGDGKIDLAIWRPSETAWYITSSGGCCGGFIINLGRPGDVLLPTTYIPQ